MVTPSFFSEGFGSVSIPVSDDGGFEEVGSDIFTEVKGRVETAMRNIADNAHGDLRVVEDHKGVSQKVMRV